MDNDGHYFGYYLCNDIWYKYNDLGPTLKEIGNYDTLLRYESEWVCRRSANLIYS